MPRLRAEQLLEIYRSTMFVPSGEARIHIRNENVREALALILTDDDAFYDSNIHIQDAPEALFVGGEVCAEMGTPRVGLCILSENLDGLLKAPKALISEPKNYFIIDQLTDHASEPPSENIARYRAVLRVIDIFSRSSSFLDRESQEILFFSKSNDESKISVPVLYCESDLLGACLDDVTDFEDIFSDPTHNDQKLSILSETIISRCRDIAPQNRFRFLLRHIGDLAERVRKGYSLFAASFSYEHIKDEIEEAKSEYYQKIHKTFTDIQGQILGIPVATVVIATQMKKSTSCGPEIWGNFAVLSGAWIFIFLLIASVVNQWVTLSSIETELEGQARRLREKYASIEENFSGTFSNMRARLSVHRAVLAGVLLIAFSGLIITYIAYGKLSEVSVITCFVS